MTTPLKFCYIALLAVSIVAVGCNQTEKTAEKSEPTSEVASDKPESNTASQTQSEPIAEVQWHTDFEKAMAEAKKTGKLVMVDFNAEWCGPCKMYEKEVFPTAEFKQKAADFILVDIDTDEQADFARKHGVGGIPDIRFFTPEGKEVGKLVGYVGLQGLLAEMDKAKQAASG